MTEFVNHYAVDKVLRSEKDENAQAIGLIVGDKVELFGNPERPWMVDRAARYLADEETTPEMQFARYFNPDRIGGHLELDGITPDALTRIRRVLDAWGYKSNILARMRF